MKGLQGGVYMIIQIPEIFYKSIGRNRYAEVRNGILEVHGFWSFKKLMVDITYELKGKNRCYYCKKLVDESEITIDHLFPEAYGGISVTNNLVPACKLCNNTKADMNKQEYEEWSNMEDKIHKKIFREKNSMRKMNKKFSSDVDGTYDLPQDWIKYERLENIRSLEQSKTKTGKTYEKTYDFVRKYQKLPVVLVVSNNYVLLDGRIAYEVAEELGLEMVPIVLLENVLAFIE